MNEKKYPLALELKDAQDVNLWEERINLQQYYTFVKINSKDLWCFKRKTAYDINGEHNKK